MTAMRLAAGSQMNHAPLTTDEIMHDFKSFYYDTALTTSEPVLLALLNFADHDKILYGSDAPYAPLDVTTFVTRSREALLVTKMGHPMAVSPLINKINRLNAQKLFGLPSV